MKEMVDAFVFEVQYVRATTQAAEFLTKVTIGYVQGMLVFEAEPMCT